MIVKHIPNISNHLSTLSFNELIKVSFQFKMIKYINKLHPVENKYHLKVVQKLLAR